MTLYKLIETEVQKFLAKERKEDTPENRIEILRFFKSKIEERAGLDFHDRFKMIQALDSEICVQRVLTHIRDKPLF